jgi:hypothetical protein
MSRTSKLVKADGSSFVRKISDIKPCGSKILVELLTAQEIMGTQFDVGTKVDVGMPQARVISLGPAVNAEGWGFKVGDRVLLHGTGPIAPEYGDSDRDKALIEPHSVFGVIVESEF